MKSVALLSLLLSVTLCQTYLSEADWDVKCDPLENAYQSLINIDLDDEGNILHTDRLYFDAALFKTARGVKNTYAEGMVEFEKENGEFWLKRYNHYDRDQYKYASFKPTDKPFRIMTPSEHTIDGESYAIEF